MWPATGRRSDLSGGGGGATPGFEGLCRTPALLGKTLMHGVYSLHALVCNSASMMLAHQGV